MQSLRPGVALLALLSLLGVAACGPRGDELVVLAAVSLSPALREVADEFASLRPDAELAFSFAGSQTLAVQLRSGARADVIATANSEILAGLHSDRLVGTPRRFASSEMVWILPSDAPDTTPTALLQRLYDPSLRLVLAAPEVPAGRYALESLELLNMREVAELRVVSRELDVRGVLAKVQIGGADLGIVYASDVTPLPDDARLVAVEFPEGTRVSAEFFAAACQGSEQPLLARLFVSFLVGDRAQAILRAHGFGPG